MCTGQHFGGLLDSAAANAIVEQKIESALKGPEGTPPSSLLPQLYLSPSHHTCILPSLLPSFTPLSLTHYVFSLLLLCVCVL